MAQALAGHLIAGVAAADAVPARATTSVVTALSALAEGYARLLAEPCNRVAHQVPTVPALVPTAIRAAFPVGAVGHAVALIIRTTLEALLADPAHPITPIVSALLVCAVRHAAHRGPFSIAIIVVVDDDVVVEGDLFVVLAVPADTPTAIGAAGTRV